MSADIGIRIGVEGENTFKSALSGVNAQLKRLKSEMKATASSMDSMGDEQQAAAKKADILTRSIDASKQKISILTQQYDKAEAKLQDLGTALSRAKSEFGEHSAEAVKAQNAYNRQAAAVDRLGAQLADATADMNRMERELDDIRTAANRAERELDDLGDAAEDVGRAGKGIGDNLKAGFAGFVGGAVSGFIQSAVDGMRNLVDSTKEFRTIMGQLEVSSDHAGYTAAQTEASYKQLYGVLGDEQAAATALANFQAMGLSQEDLTKAIDGGIGAWAKYGDSIPIDGLAESINETAKAGAVTGTFADVLNWAGTSEDEFNEKLASAGSNAERMQIILDELARQGLPDVADAFRENNKELVAANDAQLELNDAMAGLGEALSPAVTAATNGISTLINGFISILDGARQYIDPAIQSIKDSISGIGKAFQNAFGEEKSAAIMDFFGRLGSALVGLPFQVVAFGVDVVTTALEFLINAAGAIVDFFTITLPNAFDSIANAIDAVVPNISDFGSYFETERQEIAQTMESLKESVSQAWENLKNSVETTLENMKSAISNAWETIKTTVSDAVTNVKDTVSTAFETVKTKISDTLTSAKNTVTSVFDSIKTAITDKINAARDTVVNAIERIKKAFNFSWSLPPLKLPHISVTGGVAPFGIGGKGSLPKFSISWYKDGGIMMNPTIFGASGTNLLAGGEAGPEAIAPIDLLQDYVSKAVDSTVSDVLTRLLSSQPTGGTLPPIIVPLYVNGKEFYRATIRDLNQALRDNSRAYGRA